MFYQKTEAQFKCGPMMPEKLFFLLTVLCVLFCTTLSLFREETMDIITESRSPYILRHLKHVYYVGTMDNGTLVCNIPGAVEYRWRAISKQLTGKKKYVQSWDVRLDLADESKPWLMDITPKNYRVDSMIVLCEGANGYDGETLAQVIWVITRLHSPEGYVTDPIICPRGIYSCDIMTRFYTRNLCQADVNGQTYRGTIARTREGVKCADWGLATYSVRNRVERKKTHHLLVTPPEASMKYKEAVNYKYQNYKRPLDYRLFFGHTYYSALGEHNFCRAANYPLKEEFGAGCMPFPDGLKYKVRKQQPCDVPSCSNCIYGIGKGKLLRYNFLLPKYRGRGVNTLHQYTAKRKVKVGLGTEKKQDVRLYRQCYRDKGNDEEAHAYRTENVCSTYWIDLGWGNKRVWGNKHGDPPFCMVRKGNSDKGESIRNEDKKKEASKLTKATCRLKQCTIRTVWFLFYDLDNNLIIDRRSSEVPRKFTFIEGRTATIKYYAFGMNLLSGMSLGAMNGSKPNVIGKWKNSVLRVPKKCSLTLSKPTKADQGIYYFQYVFEETNPDVDSGEYFQKFQIVVKKPLSIALTPTKIAICETDKAVLHLEIFGEMRASAIQWSYTLYESVEPTPVLRETMSIKVSTNKLKVTVSQTAWIYVTVVWKYGTLKAQAKVDVVGRPLLQHVSPLLILAKPGDNVKIAVATNDVSNKLNWVVDAQTIGRVPDDPNMAFSRIRTDKEIVHVLKIENLQPNHFGIYTVKTSNALKCRRSLDFTLRRPPELGEDGRRANSPEMTLAQEAIASFKQIMDFMKQECAQIIRSSNPPAEKKQSAPEKLPTNASKEMNETSKEDLQNEKEGKNRRKRNAPVDIEKAVSSLQEPLCANLSHRKPYIEITLGALTRIKGIRLLRPFAGDQEDTFNHDYRLLYSVNGCQWKIYGILQRITHGSNNTNITSNNNITTTQVTHQDLVGRLRDSFVTITFSASGNITWIGNKTLLFVKHIRLVPTAIDSTMKKACLRIDIFGCSAAILARKGEPKSTGVNVGAIVGGVFGGLLGSALFGLAAWRFWHLQDKHKKWCEVRKILLEKLLKIVEYTKKFSFHGTRMYQADTESRTFDSSDSESSQEHIYWEITN